MKNTAFQKSARRAVRSSAARFISIAVISFLGAGVFAGLAAVSPNMKRVGDEYYDQQNMMDIRMLSTYGFSDEDVEAIRATDGVSGVMASFTVDVAGSVGDRDYTFRINGLSPTADPSRPDYINQLKMTDGRWPERDGEAIIVCPSIGLKNIALGSTVSLDESSSAAIPDTLSRAEYTIVGIAESPCYLSFMQGTTSVGRGMIDYILYVPQQNFIVDGYTDMYVTVEGAKGRKALEDEYFDSTDPVAARLETLAEERQTLRYDEFHSDLAQARRDYQKADDKLADAKTKLANGAKALEDAKEQYADALSEYNDQKADAERRLADAKAELDDAAGEITSGENELNEKKQEYAEAESALRAVRRELDNGWADYNEKAAGLKEAKAALAENKEALDAAQSQYDQLAGLVATKDTLAQKWAEYNDGATEVEKGEDRLADAYQRLLNGEAEYSAGAAEMEDARKQLAVEERELEAAKEKYRKGLAGYNSQKAEADTKLADVKAALADVEAEIADAEKQLAEKQREYDGKKAEAAVELADAEKKIEDTEEELSDLGEPKWYVLDRHMNEGFAAYKDDTRRLRDLATAFPIVFYLVAALVCLTTMTRMVDEDRILIGTFKALGYSNGKIAGKYLLYAAFASLIGSLLGITVGFWLIPTMAWGALKIIYAVPELRLAFYTGIGMLSAFATVFITTLSTGIAAKNSLIELPAELMRPKAPKIGKRVLLEYIKPIWRRLSFTQKVTVRNFELNRKRLLMSLVGIIGCTALVVTAFGSKNAVRTILDDQFNVVLHYDAAIGFNGGEPSAGLSAHLSDQAYFEKSAEVLHTAALASAQDKDEDAYSVFVISPIDADELSDYVTLFDPETKENIPFSENSALITEKLSRELHIRAGGTIWVNYPDEDQKHPMKITGITENYALNFIYLGRAAYEKAFGGPPEYNQFFAITAGGHTNDEIKAYLSADSGVGAVSFTDDLMGNIRTAVSSVDKIIWIMIISAGLLVFVVLYNLTNINIGERQRELATLKVLGFYDKETYGYIFRETAILSVIGAVLGLFFGSFLYRAVIGNVESSMIRLTRELTWQGYLGAAILTLLFTWIVNQCMKPRIRNVDMLESLKSVE